MIPSIRNMAEQLYHAFTVISRMRYRVVVYAEQRVEDRWVEMSSTELATFGMSNRQARNRDPRMPQRPPPPPPAAAAEDQDLHLHLPQQQQRNKWCPLPLQRSLLGRPRMPQEPCGPRGEHGKPGSQARGGVHPLDLAGNHYHQDHPYRIG
jgi:hypothetical protein